MTGLKISSLILALGAALAFGQPDAPATADIPCQASAGTDAAAASPDKEGFTTLFDGTSFKGWWHNCSSEDAQANRKSGGVWKVDPKLHAIYSNQRGKGEGSMLMTNRKFGNHEIILEVWPQWGNDAGIFHRTTAAGKSFQTVIDYYDTACVGGTWPQEYENLGEFYQCSYWFHTESEIMAGTVQPVGIDYRKFTKSRFWDPDGWNDIRVKMWDSPPKHQVWIRKHGAAKWTQVLDTVWPSAFAGVDTTGHIALQVHYGTYWNPAGKGNWYRNIRIRELDAKGNPRP